MGSKNMIITSLPKVLNAEDYNFVRSIFGCLKIIFNHLETLLNLISMGHKGLFGTIAIKVETIFRR